MNVFDLIVLVLLILFVLRGAMKGMVSQFVSVGSYIICWIFASRFAFVIAPSIPAVEPWNQVGAIAVLFLIALIGIRFLHGIIERWIKNCSLARKTNMLLGGALGFVKAILICMVLTFFGVMISETTRMIIFNSKSGLKISQLIVKTGTFIPKGSCKLLEEQLEKFSVQVDGTPLDPDNEADSTSKMLQDGLNELKKIVSQYEQKNPAAESNTALKSVFDDILKRGNALLEKSKNIETESPQPAASLLDGIRKWWNGEAAEPKPQTDAGSKKLTAQKEAIQNEVNALIQEGKKTVQEKISKQVNDTLADIKYAVPKDIKPSELLPNAAKAIEQAKNINIFTPETKPLQQNNLEPLIITENPVQNTVESPALEKTFAVNTVNNTLPDITSLPFLKELEENPAEQTNVQTIPMLNRAEPFMLLKNNRQGQLKTADILNNKPLSSDVSSQPAVLFQR